MNNTKKISQKFALMIMGVIFSITVSNAQPPRGDSPREIPDGPQIEKMVNHLEKELSLTADQKAKITALFVSHFDKVKAERERDKPQMEKMRETHEKMKKEFESSLEAQLTPEQTKQFEVFKEKRQHEGQKGRKKCERAKEGARN